MINLRYHIVSITAVFLALGIGLTLGTSFLDRVTVDTLKQQVDEVEARVRETDEENARLTSQLERYEQRDEALALGAGRLVEGRLTDVPVLVLVTEGTDGERVDQVLDTLVASGADVAGAWRLTERWDLDDAEEVAGLADSLEITSEDAERVFSAATSRLGLLLADASAPADDGATSTDGGQDPTAEATGDAGAAQGAGDAEPSQDVPPLVESLAAAGFLEHQAPAGSGADEVLLTDAGMRYVVISDASPQSGQQRAAAAVVRAAAREGVVPVVAAQGDTDLVDDAGEPAAEDDRRTTFVGPLRDDEELRERLTTIDDLDSAAGLIGVVLALQDLAEGVVGHYGVGPGATGLVPGSDTP